MFFDRILNCFMHAEQLLPENNKATLTFRMKAKTLVVAPEVIIADANTPPFRVIAVTVKGAGSALNVQQAGLSQIASCQYIFMSCRKILRNLRKHMKLKSNEAHIPLSYILSTYGINCFNLTHHT